MGDQFELPVDFKGKELQFPAELIPFGFSYRIKVSIAETDFYFEPDEEKNYRAILADTDKDKSLRIDWELLQTITQKLHELFVD